MLFLFKRAFWCEEQDKKLCTSMMHAYYKTKLLENAYALYHTTYLFQQNDRMTYDFLMAHQENLSFYVIRRHL